MLNNIMYFVCGAEFIITCILLYMYLKDLLVRYGNNMYKKGYAQSQAEDTKQLLQACKSVPSEVGNIIFKSLTGSDMPNTEKEVISEKEIGFNK